MTELPACAPNNDVEQKAKDDCCDVHEVETGSLEPNWKTLDCASLKLKAAGSGTA